MTAWEINELKTQKKNRKLVPSLESLFAALAFTSVVTGPEQFGISTPFDIRAFFISPRLFLFAKFSFISGGGKGRYIWKVCVQKVPMGPAENWPQFHILIISELNLFERDCFKFENSTVAFHYLDFFRYLRNGSPLDCEDVINPLRISTNGCFDWF